MQYLQVHNARQVCCLFQFETPPRAASRCSSTLLQHLFTHMFFCHLCSFYTYSNHSLYQHMSDKHQSQPHTDPKQLDLLYVTRCSDGTFALCIDSAATDPVPAVKAKARKKWTRKNPYKTPEKAKIEVVPPPVTKPTRVATEEKPSRTFVLMKHRRCFSSKRVVCLHSLTVEYNACQEHTIRHMSRTHGTIRQRRRFPPITDTWRLIDEIATCLKCIVNTIVNDEDHRYTERDSDGLRDTLVDILVNHLHWCVPYPI